MSNLCKTIACNNYTNASLSSDYCEQCFLLNEISEKEIENTYSFIDVSDHELVDPYMIHSLFGLHDPSGALQEASKKLLLSYRGNTNTVQDIIEARNILNRWLEIASN